MKKLALYAIASLLACFPGWAQVQISPLVMPRKQFLDASGRPLAGGHVCTYRVGTTTPQVTYTSYTGAVQNGICDPLTVPLHSDGIVLDAGGYASIYVNCTQSPFKIVVYDANLVLQWSEDGVQYPDCSGGAGPHNLLSATHPDTSPYTPPEIGDLIRGSATQEWQRFQRGPLGDVLTMVNSGGTLLPDWAPPGVGPCTTLNSVTHIYVGTAGNDVTGDGSIGNPFRNPYKAIPLIPGIVCGLYKIHLIGHGTYDVSGAKALNLAGRIFAGGGYDPYSTAFQEYPWATSTPAVADTTWVVIEGDPIPGDAGAGGDDPDDFILDHGSSCDNLPAISVSGANLVLRGLSVRNAGYGLLSHSSKVKLSGVTFQDNCTGVDAGFNSLIYYDKKDTNTGSWCTLTDCWYAEIRSSALFTANFSILLHDNSFMSDETPDDDDSASASQIHLLGPGGGLGMLVEKDSFINVIGGLKIANNAAQGGIVARHQSFVRFGYYDHDLNGSAGPSVTVEEASVIDVPTSSFNIKNTSAGTPGVQLDTGGVLLNTPTFTNVGLPFASTTSSGFNIKSLRSIDNAIALASYLEVVPFSATPTFSAQTGGIKKMTLTGDVTLSSVSSPNEGMDLTFIICQDGGGAHAFAWPANFKGAVAIGATASKCSTQRFVYDQASTTWWAVPGNDM